MTIHEPSAIDAIEHTIKRMSVLKKGGTEVKHTLHKLFLSSKATRRVADLLHGSWLGHPLHPVLTDVTLGAWLFGTAFDVMYRMTGQRKWRDSADTLTQVGTITAIPTAITGMTDYSAIKQDAVEYGALHGLLNSVILLLYVGSVRARKNGERETGMLLSSMGLGLGLASAWLGGELVYRMRVGVNHVQAPSEPEEWRGVMLETELEDEQPLRLDVDGSPVLLYRTHGQIFAIHAVCAHAGGPLEEGTFDGNCVQCPWHDSVYDLRDGSIVHGPTTYSQPAYETRIRNGEIEIRLAHVP